MAAERETVDRLIAAHLSNQIGATFEGRISGATRAGLFVKLDETGADGFIPAALLGDDYFRHDAALHALIGSRTGQMHRLGDIVTVKLVEAAPLAGALRFELLCESAPRQARPGPAKAKWDRGALSHLTRPVRAYPWARLRSPEWLEAAIAARIMNSPK